MGIWWGLAGTNLPTDSVGMDGVAWWEEKTDDVEERDTILSRPLCRGGLSLHF